MFASTPALSGSEGGQDTVALAVADGRPWNLTLGESGKAHRAILRADGTGTMEGGFKTMTLRWRFFPAGLCLKPEVVFMKEHCVTLVTRPDGYDAMENGSIFFRLRR